MQAPVFGDMGFRASGMSEDCLYLNVWTPGTSGKERLPVLVYFYGGGFVAGDGSEPRYDGESMAAKGIVPLPSIIDWEFLVFWLIRLTKESPHPSVTMLLDQYAALRWVKETSQPLAAI